MPILKAENLHKPYQILLAQKAVMSKQGSNNTINNEE